MVPLLPYVEQNNVHSMFDLQISNGDGSDFRVSDTHPNAEAVSTWVDLFLCPSDNPSTQNRIMGTANPAPSNYAGNIGWPSLASGFEGEDRRKRLNGVIPLERPADPAPWHGSTKIGFGDISDGSSITALISERLIQSGNSVEEVRDSDERLRSRHIVPSGPEPLTSIADRIVRSNDPHIVESAYIGRSWSSGYPLAGPTYVHILPPNSRLAHFSSVNRDGDFLVTPSSNHSGGVNLARADGSVSFVSEDISREVWWALGARNDGRALSYDN
jgi:prepilin-type processing-associated H-X9-DG protein